MNNLLLVIDVQKAFINENTQHIPNKINELINQNKYDNIVFTRFINDEHSLWVEKLDYKECISENWL